MSDPHCAVRGVDALPARSLRAEDVDPEILVFDLDVDLLRLGEHGHRRRGRVDAPLRFGHRNPLHPVDARFVTQGPVHAGPTSREDGFLQPAEIPF